MENSERTSQLSIIPFGTSGIRSTAMSAPTSICKSMAQSASTEECWWRVCHQVGSVTVVHVDLSPCARRERYAVSRLNTGEQMHRHRFRSARRKREFSLCRAALRAIVCHRLDCPNRDLSFGLSRYGKPFALVGGTRVPVSFNLSHSGLHGLIAVDRAGRIGVDVEVRLPRPDLWDTVRTIMTPIEARTLSRCPKAEKDHQLYRIWTLKEAIAKAVGMGFSLDLTGFSIPAAMLDGMRTCKFRFPQDPSVRWQLEDLGNTFYAAALVLELSQDALGRS